MYSADEVVRYVINYSYDIGFPVTNVKLQILLYYIQAYYIVNGEKCFDSDLLKYRFGPCVKGVYDKYRVFTCNEIQRQNTFLKITVNGGRIENEKVKFDYEKYKLRDRIIFETIINSFSRIKPWELVDYVKKEYPWIAAKKYKDIIKEVDIKAYYAVTENKQHLFGKFELSQK